MSLATRGKSQILVCRFTHTLIAITDNYATKFSCDIPDESQKEKEKGTDIKFLGFRPYFFSKPTGVRDKCGGC